MSKVELNALYSETGFVGAKQIYELVVFVITGEERFTTQHCAILSMTSLTHIKIIVFIKTEDHKTF